MFEVVEPKLTTDLNVLRRIVMRTVNLTYRQIRRDRDGGHDAKLVILPSNPPPFSPNNPS